MGDEGRGFGPPRSSAPTESSRDHPGERRAAERSRQRGRGTTRNRRRDHQKGKVATTAPAALSEAESAERAAGQMRFLPDDLRVQHGAGSSEVCGRPRPCSGRGCRVSGQDGLGPYPPAARGRRDSVFSFDGSTVTFFLPLAKRKWGWKATGLRLYPRLVNRFSARSLTSPGSQRPFPARRAPLGSGRWSQPR